MAARNGPASAGSCMAATETSPSTLDPMCGKMRGHSDMPHPHRIAVKLGMTRLCGDDPHASFFDDATELFSCNPVHQQWMGGSSGLKKRL